MICQLPQNLVKKYTYFYCAERGFYLTNALEDARSMLPRGAWFCVCDSGRFRSVRNKLLESVQCNSVCFMVHFGIWLGFGLC